MLSAERRQGIVDQVRSEGRVEVAGLSQTWKVSEDTIRRDLNELADEGLVRRVHGGALPAAPAEGDYGRRQGLSVEAKARLGRCAAALVRPGSVVGVDGGTSTLQLIRALPLDLRCTVVTHSPLIAAELSTHPQIEVLIVGGRLFRHSQVAVGSETTQALARLRLDLFFLGATGLRPDTGATTGDWEEAAVKRAFCAAAAETVLLVSPEKWGVSSAFGIVTAADLAALVVDSGTPEEVLTPYRALGLTIHQAQPAS